MEIIKSFIDIILHLDKHLALLVSQYGTLTYAILFFIIFAETGLVVTPFLPGDSLLFAAGAVTAIGSLNIFLIIGILMCAAILGDCTNYWIGRKFGISIANNPKFPLINSNHIVKTEKFFEKYGTKAVIIARFIPIVRTFTPFIAGIGKMPFRRFIAYSIIGGISWISIFTLSGFFFGNIPIIKKNFHYVIFAIIFISFVPAVYEYIKEKRTQHKLTLKQNKIEEIVNK